MTLTLEGVSRTVNGVEHLSNINMSLEPGTFNVLLGRTLSGKTSLMRLMAGLDKPDHGKLMMGGKDVTDISVRKRNVSMVYQQFINYPHLTVFDNIASPLRVAGLSDSRIKRKVTEVAALLHIEEFLQRYPLDLSGGQQQRTSMARALVKDASLILFDEPLVNLDYKLREELRAELKDLFKERKTIVVYATTEPGEALALGGTATLLNEGRIVQSGPVMDVYLQPRNSVAADLFSEPSMNFLTITEHKQAGDGSLGIRPEHVRLSRSSASDLALDLTVDVAEISGSETFLHMHGKEGRGQDGQCYELVARLRGVHQYDVGDALTVYLPQTKLFQFDGHGNTVIKADHPQIYPNEASPRDSVGR